MIASFTVTLGNVNGLRKVILYPPTPTLAPDKSFGKLEGRVLRGRVHSELFGWNSQLSTMQGLPIRLADYPGSLFLLDTHMVFFLSTLPIGRS